MPPFSFWHVLAHPHLSEGLKSPGGKKPTTRVKQKLPICLLIFFRNDLLQGSGHSCHQHRGTCCRLNCPADLPSWQMLLHRTQLSRGCVLPCPTEMSWTSTAAEVTPCSGNSTDFSLSAYRAGQKIIFQDTSQHQFTSFILEIVVPLQARQVSIASCNAGLCFLRIWKCKKNDCLLFSNNKWAHF